MTIPYSLYLTGKSQCWLKLTFHLFPAYTQAVNMCRRKHSYHVDYLTLNLWLPLSGISLSVLPRDSVSLLLHLCILTSEKTISHRSSQIFPLPPHSYLLLISLKIDTIWREQLPYLPNSYIWICIHMYFILFFPTMIDELSVSTFYLLNGIAPALYLLFHLYYLSVDEHRSHPPP